MTLKISVITVSQLKRFNCLRILNDLLEEQTYKKYIIEWRIVEGSKTINDAIINSNKIDELKLISTLPIKYIPFSGLKLGGLRNLSNKDVEGDYIICCDDDDYYYPDRIEHTVNELMKSNKLIAGCTNCHIFDYQLIRQYNVGNYGEHWSTNGCLAYKKEYLINHRYDNNKEMGEEGDFLENLKVDMIQLNPDKITIMSSHDINTYNKRHMLIQASLNAHPLIKETPITIPDKYYQRYRSIFIQKNKMIYDIVYVCGFFTVPWNLLDKNLGGSEQAIQQLSINWSNLGYKVAIYGNMDRLTYENIECFPMYCFNYQVKYKTLIIWRENGLYSVMPFIKKQPERLFLDLHDNINLSSNKHFYKNYINRFDKILLKSQYHLDSFNLALETSYIEDGRFIILPNGIRDQFFNIVVDESKRKHNKYIYCSCYTRGLLYILKYMWKIIYEDDPMSELHIYYGQKYLKEEFKKELMPYLAQEGVIDHGRRPLDEIIEAKKTSKFHLYITNNPLEIDCISVRESVEIGCIPLLADVDLWKERDGIKFKYEGTTEEQLIKIANEIVNNKNNYVIEKKFINRDWSYVAKEILK